MGRPGGKRAANPKAPTPQKDDNIIFEDDKPRKPPRRNEVPKLDAAGEGGSEDATKKPDTKTLIGGASWTGKLPVNMLSEHCQKQKWMVVT